MARKKKHEELPQVPDLFRPVIQALLDLDGSGNIDEINENAYSHLKLTDEALNIMHGDDGRTEIDYRLAWARTILKKYGLIENSARGVWALTKPNIKISDIDPDEIDKTVRGVKPSKSKDKPKEEKEETIIEQDVPDWKEILLETLLKISPSAFERLAQRLLRESGFIQVEVTGKTGDGGIDGKGIVRISGFLSFHVIFQCKRYRNSVTPSQIRDFRGAMQGRADKGLFITTGTFTREALKEATRDGAPPIDLIDGDLLCDKLKELKLGVETELIENVKINEDWFNKF